jgi:hypothetical protein
MPDRNPTVEKIKQQKGFFYEFLVLSEETNSLTAVPTERK